MMGNVYFLYYKDITTQTMNNAILDYATKSKNMVYIISSYGLKSVRVDMNTHTLTEAKVMAIGEFESKVKKQVYKRRDYITKADQRYLLNRIIEKNYKCTEQYGVYKSITKDLFTLFDFLQFNDISPLDEKTLGIIKQDYSGFEHDIFSLYSQFCSLINNLMQAVETGNTEPNLSDYGIRSLKKTANNIKTLNSRIKAQIDLELSQGDAVFFDGFYLLSDTTKYTVESAMRQGIDTYFIAKLDLSDYDSAFIYEDNYKKLASKYGKEIQTINLDTAPHQDITALDYFRQVFPDAYLEPTPEEKQRINDGSIEILAPFICREDEFAYVAKRISEYLKDLNTKEIEILKKALNNDITVIIPVDWKRHAHMVKSALKKVGLFVLNEQIDELFSDIDINDIKRIYYSKSDFINETIKKKDGSVLNLQQKLVFFEKCFTGLSIRTSPRPISAYPVGQYVHQIYSFATDGMNTHKFKLVLYSNWYYHTRKSETKWDKYINDFSLIEQYFSDKTDISDWLTEFERLRKIRVIISDNPLYLYHPLANVAEESLAFIKQVVETINGIMKLIDFMGSIEEHISALINDVMNPFEITDIDRGELQVEQANSFMVRILCTLRLLN